MMQWLPHRKEWLSWVYVSLLALVIFISIPIARSLQEVIAERWGREVFTHIVLACIVLGAIAATAVLLRRGAPSMRGVFGILCVASVFVAYTLALDVNPEESVHLVEYGLLGLLACLAFSHRTQDAAVYGLAALLVGILGILEETIQWLTPGRFWGLDDIALNFAAGALAQVMIAVGFRPAQLNRRPSYASLARLFRLAAAGLLLLGLSFANTPERIVSYAGYFPRLQFLLEENSTMVEYGYLYTDPEIGVFRSRLRPEELRKANEERGVSTAEILDRYESPEDYDALLWTYSSLIDPFVYEVSVHFFRRDHYLRRAKEVQTSNPGSASGAFTVAYRENQILEKYFPNVVAHSARAWPARLNDLVQGFSAAEPNYDSKVGQALVTSVTPWQASIAFALGVVGCVLLAMFFERRGRREATRRI